MYIYRLRPATDLYCWLLQNMHFETTTSTVLDSQRNVVAECIPQNVNCSICRFGVVSKHLIGAPWYGVSTPICMFPVYFQVIEQTRTAKPCNLFF